MKIVNEFVFTGLGVSVRRSGGYGAFARFALGGLLGVAAGCANATAEGVVTDAEVASTRQALARADSSDLARWNELATTFYDPSNVIQVDITMDPDAWEELKASVPRGEVCNGEYIGERYDWYDAAEVSIRGSTYGDDPVVVGTSVKLKKRGWCSSWNTGRPSLKIKFTDSDATAAQEQIGTRSLALNNNWSPDMFPPFQDPHFVRTCLGYRLFKEAGLPYSRCNFVAVRVNGEPMPFGPYINVEPIEELYAYNNFNQNTLGNLYEFELGEDFDIAMKERTEHKGFSPYTDKKDFERAAEAIAAGNLGSVLDVDQFIKYYAMELLLQHQDSYSGNQNNVFVYNDVQAVADPDPAAGQVQFKFIPWGVDRILGGWEGFFKESILTQKVAADPNLSAQLRSQIDQYLDSVFNPDQIDTEFVPYLQTLQAAFNALQPDYLPAETASYFGEILKQRRAYIERILAETPPACDENTAVDLGKAGNLVTVPTDGCVKVQDYPQGWGIHRTMKLENPTGTYDVPFTWSNSCSGGSGSDTFTADWQAKFLPSISSDCATVIDLQGPSTGTITLRYWAN